MSDEKQPRFKRAAPAPQTADEFTAPPLEAPQTAPAALPEPAVKLALPAPVPKPSYGADGYFAAYRAALASIGESQMAVASDMTAMALEMSGLARTSLTAAGDSLAALLMTRSFVDAVETQLGFVRRSIDTMAGGSKRIGEIGLRLANDAAKPVLRPIATP